MSKSHAQHEMDKRERKKVSDDHREQIRQDIIKEWGAKHDTITGMQYMTLLGMELGRRMDEEKQAKQL